MLIRFWGTRGSIPTPGRSTALYGGNTSCVEVRADDGTVVALDCGTGARPLGVDLLSRGPTLPEMHILVTHTHWDHIQGFPFFLPAYVAGTRLSVYGARGLDRTLEGSLSGQMQHTYFPVQLDELRADIKFEEVAEERFRVGPFRVTSQLINHTTATVGYRLDGGDVSIAYVTDHEPFWWERTGARRTHRFIHPGEERHVAFVAGVDVLIHDAQYADSEYPAKRGWGHSTIEYAVDVARVANVKRLVLFHHDPNRDDDGVDALARAARERAGDMDVVAAAEGDELVLGETAIEDHAAAEGPRAPKLQTRARILVADDDRAILHVLDTVLSGDGYQVVTVEDGEAAVERARSDGFDLILLDIQMPRLDGLAAARKLRGEPRLAGVPIVMLTARNADRDIEAAFAEGVTDYITKPFAVAQMRARVRSWLARSADVER